jgi:FMN phosphatase YigB (HAD superfamily)
METGARDIQNVESIFRNYYQITNDFDVVGTSYDAGVEKPEAGIWRHTEELTTPTVMSRGEKDVEQADNFKDYATKSLEAVKYGIDRSKMIRIHIGDEHSKDYVGATEAGWEALHLVRLEDPPKDLGRDVQLVRSLDEVAMIVNVMANELFQQARV